MAAKKPDPVESNLRPGSRPAVLEDVRNWPTRSQAARMLHLSSSELDDLVLEGEIDVQFHPETGSKRYDPTHIRALIPTPESSSFEVVKHLTSVLKVHQEQSKTANDQMRQMLAMLLEHYQQMFAASHLENEGLRTRARSLEDQHLAVVTAYEKNLSEQHERELLVRTVDREQARSDKIVDGLMDQIPRAIEHATMGSSVKRLIDSLSQEQLTVLEGTGFLQAEQLAYLKKIRERLAALKKPPNGKTPVPVGDAPPERTESNEPKEQTK